ncbi:MAG: rhomboid family intramembrane serine protease [Acidobacteriota bacterium]|nr:rhomboid family intramembrane serine protease [Acidobacteriota bacterium]
MTNCASCGREFVASSDAENLCPQCAAEMPPGEPLPATPQQTSSWGFLLHSPTVALIAANALIFAAMAIESRQFVNFDVPLLMRWGANSAPLTCGGQWWRLLTSTFLHAGIAHIAINMWVLFNLGWSAELLFGRWRFTLLYLLSGIGGSLASVCWLGNALSVGASGAIFGVAGALLPAMLLEHDPRLRSAFKGQLISVAVFVVYSLAAGMQRSGTDNAAHVGGLVIGALLGAIFPSGATRLKRGGLLRVLAGVFLAASLFAFASAYAIRRSQPLVEADRAQTLSRAGHGEEALLHARRAAALDPGNAHLQFMLGTLLLEQKQYQDALEPLQNTVRLLPTWGPGYVNLCLAQVELHQFSAARANCEQGAKFAPNDTESWFNLGRARYLTGDRDGARQALAKAVSINPNGYDENLQYALMLVDAGNFAEAIPYLQKAHDLRPDDRLAERLLQHSRKMTGQ